MLTGVGVDVSKFFRVGARAESESEKCDSVHLWCKLLGFRLKPPGSKTTVYVPLQSNNSSAVSDNPLEIHFTSGCFCTCHYYLASSQYKGDIKQDLVQIRAERV